MRKKRYVGLKRGAKPFYPWDKWLKETGRWLHLRKGKDFRCELSTMSYLLRMQAKSRKVEIHIYRTRDSKGIKVMVGKMLREPNL